MKIHIQVSGGEQSLFSETLKFDKWISLHLRHSSHEVLYHRHIDRLDNRFSSLERRQLKKYRKKHQNYATFWHLWRESTGHRWTPFTKDQWCGNWFKVMPPSCYSFYKTHAIFKTIQHAYSLFDRSTTTQDSGGVHEWASVASQSCRPVSRNPAVRAATQPFFTYLAWAWQWNIYFLSLHHMFTNKTALNLTNSNFVGVWLFLSGQAAYTSVCEFSPISVGNHPIQQTNEA